jgi:hypothetical protein
MVGQVVTKRVPEPNLLVEGQDLGPATSPVSGDGEYEFVYEVAADKVPALLQALGAERDADVLDELAARWTGAASHELERILRDSKLAHVFVL